MLTRQPKKSEDAQVDHPMTSTRANHHQSVAEGSDTKWVWKDPTQSHHTPRPFENQPASHRHRGRDDGVPVEFCEPGVVDVIVGAYR